MTEQSINIDDIIFLIINAITNYIQTALRFIDWLIKTKIARLLINTMIIGFINSIINELINTMINGLINKIIRGLINTMINELINTIIIG